MDMADDEAVPEGLHSIAEDIAADCLDDVLCGFRVIGFNAFPFLCGADAFIGDGFPTVSVFADTGFHICQIAT